LRTRPTLDGLFEVVVESGCTGCVANTARFNGAARVAIDGTAAVIRECHCFDFHIIVVVVAASARVYRHGNSKVRSLHINLVHF
jgi:hypothetical protein